MNLKNQIPEKKFIFLRRDYFLMSLSFLKNIYRDTIDAINDVRTETPLDEVPDKVFILPEYALPKGVIAGVGKLYDGAKAMFVNAKAFYMLPYSEKKAVMAHELGHLHKMAGGKLSDIVGTENEMQSRILDANFSGDYEEGSVNWVAQKLYPVSNVLKNAYREATNSFDSIMNAATDVPQTAENTYNMVLGKNCVCRYC